MKKLLLLLSGIALLLASCSSDDGAAANSDAILVKKAVSVETDGTQGMTLNYSYNGNKISTVQTSDGQIAKYFYSQNLIVKGEKYFSGNSNAVIEVVYQYDTNERLVSEEYKDFSNSILETRMYTYEEDGSVSFLAYSGEIGSITELKSTGKYFFNEDNEVIKIESTNLNTNNVVTRSLTYDTRNNIFKNVPGWNKLFPTLTGKKHNILTSTTIGSDQVVLDAYSNQCEYNNAGYPISISTTIGSHTTKVNYFY